MAHKPFEDGDKRVMQPGPYLGAERNKVKVIAHKVDCDTPYVILEFGDVELWMSDALAHDVIKRMQRALDILPTSK